MKAGDDFLGAFMGSNARAKVLRAFIFDRTALTIILAGKRSGVSSRVAAEEIKALENLGIVKKAKFSITVGGVKKIVAGKQKEVAWTLNAAFKFTPAISKFVHEVSPVQYKNLLAGLRKAGKISAVILSGSFLGDDSRPVDLIVVGDTLNEGRLETAVRALEREFNREIRYASLSTPELRYRLTIQDRLLRETFDFPHLVLVDKTKLL